MYRVIKFFTDLQDNDHPYNAGDSFPREGIEVTEERLAELAGSDNKQGEPLIVLVEPIEKPVNEADTGKVMAKTPKRGRRKTAVE